MASCAILESGFPFSSSEYRIESFHFLRRVATQGYRFQSTLQFNSHFGEGWGWKKMASFPRTLVWKWTQLTIPEFELGDLFHFRYRQPLYYLHIIVNLEVYLDSRWVSTLLLELGTCHWRIWESLLSCGRLAITSVGNELILNACIYWRLYLWRKYVAPDVE